MIRVEGLTFGYTEGPPILRGIDLGIGECEFVGLVGANGSGKSTLARHFNGLLLPDQGRVTVDGFDTADDEKIWEIRTLVGMVLQNPENQIVGSVVEDDVAFGPENLGVPAGEIRSRVDNALRSTGLEGQIAKTPANLSGGQKQRLAIAGALAMLPRYLVLDEATSMLDPEGRREVLQVIQELHRREGMTIVLVTHLLEELEAADRIVAIEGGTLAFDGPPEGLLGERGLLERLELDPPPLRQVYLKLLELGLIEDLPAVTAESLAAALTDGRSPQV